MNIIMHRVNTINQLISIDTNYGVEIDIRSYKDNLVLTHEPYENGENFDNWLEYYNHKIIILNIKEEGLEDKVLSLIKKHRVKNYFFLDQSFPNLIRYINNGMSKTAIRVSEFESIKNTNNLVGLADWIWIDCFTKFPLTGSEMDALKKNFNICIVSPELQGRNDKSEIIQFAEIIHSYNIDDVYVCTKFPDLWGSNV